MGTVFVMLLSTTFLVFCFLKLKSEKGSSFKRCICLILLVTICSYLYRNLSLSEKIYSHASRARQNFQVWETGAVTTESDPTPMENISYKKWIVVTSIARPTTQIEKLSHIPGWKLVVVADKKTPTNWTFPNVIMLDIPTQLRLGYHILEHLPWDSYTRKAIGYLYAIHHGADIIYDTDDDNAPNDLGSFDQGFDLSTTTRGLIMTGDIIEDDKESWYAKNPYAHFGTRSIWPRGFPLQRIGQEYNNTYTVCPKLRTPLIQQGLVNGDPDVDAIFRLTRKKLHTPLNIHFDGYAPPAIYPPQLFAPFNSQNTVFRYDAFWALLLPASVSFRVTDIWRGYWAQPLLWRVGGTLGFYPPHTTQIRNAHVYLKDFGEEDQMYKQSWELIQLLSEWECSSSEGKTANLYECMIQLTELMADKKMWSGTEVKLVKAWIEDLKSIGYKTPAIQVPTSAPCLDETRKSFATFNGNNWQEKQAKSRSEIGLRKFCNFKIWQGSNRTNRTALSFSSTLLVITFNIPNFEHYKNIWLLDLIYRPHYPNIIYCGQLKDGVKTYQNLISSPEFIAVGVTQFSLLNSNMTNGIFAYECATRAIEMNYGVNEYIVMSDDILLNFWNNDNFNPNETWAFKHPILKRKNATHIECGEYMVFNLDTPHSSSIWDKWPWWKGAFGLNVTKTAVDLIYSSTNPTIMDFRKQWSNFGLNRSSVMCGPSDIFHFPKLRQEAFYEVAQILRESQVFLEIAVPFILSGLSSSEMAVNLPADHIWGTDRNTPLNFFNASSSVIHPVKLSEVIRNWEFRREYCFKYVQQVLDLK